jgi:hypothetical protein
MAAMPDHQQLPEDSKTPDDDKEQPPTTSKLPETTVVPEEEEDNNNDTKDNPDDQPPTTSAETMEKDPSEEMNKWIRSEALLQLEAAWKAQRRLMRAFIVKSEEARLRRRRQGD